MPFKSLLDVSFIPGEEKVKLNSPLKYIIPDNFPEKELRGLEINAPPGFINDLASIPQLAQVLFSKIGFHRRAAGIHDWLYFTGKYDKKTADLIFLFAMKEDNVNIFKRRTMYWAVKYGGYFAWRGHRKKEAKR